MANPIRDLIESAMDSIDGMFTAENVIGETVTTSDGTMIIPIARVSFGVGGGGSEFSGKDSDGNNLFGGGVGAGASIKPEGFLVITTGGSIRFVSTSEGSSAVEKLIDYTPDLIDKVSGIFKNKHGERQNNDNT
jgi:sporulation protein YtfJ